MSPWGDWTIHALKKDEKRAKLVGSKGRLTGLRIHALRFDEATARHAAIDLATANPDYTFTPKEIKHHAR